ncbi:MAG TPA: hypothetical protein VLY21_02930 [Nitrososphaerales archaeon]|nr:hypothetical protein [Nitrososphaerales archaeon]
MDTAAPIYVSHRKWGSLIYGALLLAVGLGIAAVPSLDRASADAASSSVIEMYVVAVFFGGIGAAYVWGFLRSSGITFYEDFIRVSAPVIGGESRELGYPSIEVGALKNGRWQGRHFSVSVKNAKKSFFTSRDWWDATDGKVRGSDEKMHHWLMVKLGYLKE